MNDESKTTPLEPAKTADLVLRANEILRRGEEICVVGDASLLVLRDRDQQRTLDHIRAHAHHLETRWTDRAFDITGAVLDSIAHTECPAGSSVPSPASVRRFEALFFAARTAIEEVRPIAAGLVRCCCMAAQDLRRAESTGKLGPVRLRARLLVAHLIGSFARFDASRACLLACLNLYATAISAAQIADCAARTIAWPAGSDGSIRDAALRNVAKAYWARCADDPESAKASLAESWLLLHTSGKPAREPALQDLYLTVAVREMARIDGPVGFAWSGEIADVALRCAGCLLACLNGPAWSEGNRIEALRQTIHDLGRHHLLDVEPDLGRLAKGIVAEAKLYPEFPPLDWDEISQPGLSPRVHPLRGADETTGLTREHIRRLLEET